MSAVLTPMDPGRWPDDGKVAQLRVPPQAIEAESSVLGGLLLDAGAFDRVGDLLTESDFYRTEHRLIFGAITALAMASKQADVITVFNHLQQVGKGDEAGGLVYLNALAQYVPSAGNIRRYAEIVRERSILRKLVSASDEIATSAFNTQGRAVDTLLDEAVQKVMGIDATGSGDEWASMDQLVLQQLDEVQAMANGDPREQKPYIPTGLADLDEILDGGLRGGQLIIIAARPSMGKSAMADTIGLHTALHLGLPVGKFSMEMQNREGGQRALSSVSHIPLHALRRPERMSDLHWSSLTRGVEMLRNVPFYSNDKGGLNINQLRSKARALRRRHGLKLLLVDYLQLMTGTDPRAPRHLQLEECTRGMKALAKELDIPVVCLSQVNRGVEKEADPMPRMSDLKDSGSIEQDADVILFLHRPIVFKKDLGDEWKRYAKADLAKQRGGRTGLLNFHYVGENTTFHDWPADLEIPTSQVRTKGAGSAL